MSRDMDDSSMFLEWAANQLHHQHPTGTTGDGGAAVVFPSLQALRNASQQRTTQTAPAAAGQVRDLTVNVDHWTNNSNNSWSSGGGDSPGAGAAMDLDAAAAGWSPHSARATTTGLGGSNTNNMPVSWDFTAASAQPTTDDVVAMPDAATAKGRRVGSGGSGSASSSSPGPVQDHIIAERRRREKINQRFIELSTVIPGLKKMDKATILGDAIKYVRDLQDKVKTLEKDGGAIQSSTVLVKKLCRVLDDDDGAAASGGGSNGDFPEIEARLSDNNVLLRIHCDNTRGVLVKVLSEVEKMGLAITHTNVMPFPSSTAIITITAKIDEEFSTTVEEIVRRINCVLHEHSCTSAEEK